MREGACLEADMGFCKFLLYFACISIKLIIFMDTYVIPLLYIHIHNSNLGNLSTLCLQLNIHKKFNDHHFILQVLLLIVQFKSV